MEVHDEGAPPVRVIYIESTNAIPVQEGPIYIIPDVIRGEGNIEDNDADTAPPSPVPSVISDATTETIDEESNDPPEAMKPAEEEPSKKRSYSDVEKDEDDDDDGRLCPICYDNWTNAGEHRLCSLRCGHLFGLSCVTRWLDSQRKKTCPSCKKHVSRNDIRYIYAKKVITVDTHVVELLKKQLVDVNCEKVQLQMELTKSKCRESLLMQEVASLKQQIMEFSAKNVPQKIKSMPSNTVKLYKDKSLEISSGCRVFDANTRLNTIAVSSKSPNALFAGFGIRKVTISDYKLATFLPLHSDAIRDVAFHPENNGLLTASLDKFCKFVDCSTNSTAISIGCGIELWSCCWDSINENIFYVGTRQGSVLRYDLRQPSNYVSVYNVPGDMSPVVSVASFSKEGLSAVISCKLNSLWAFSGNEDTPMQLPVDGPFISMRCEPLTKQVLVSSRPNSNFPYTRHTLFTVDKSSQCNIVHTFRVDSKPNFLTRSCFIMHKNDYVAAHSEKDKCVVLWSINTGSKVTSAPAYDPVLDLCSFKINDEQFLISLTEKKMDFFKFT